MDTLVLCSLVVEFVERYQRKNNATELFDFHYSADRDLRQLAACNLLALYESNCGIYGFLRVNDVIIKWFAEFFGKDNAQSFGYVLANLLMDAEGMQAGDISISHMLSVLRYAGGRLLNAGCAHGVGMSERIDLLEEAFKQSIYKMEVEMFTVSTSLKGYIRVNDRVANGIHLVEFHFHLKKDVESSAELCQEVIEVMQQLTKDYGFILDHMKQIHCFEITCISISVDGFEHSAPIFQHPDLVSLGWVFFSNPQSEGEEYREKSVQAIYGKLLCSVSMVQLKGNGINWKRVDVPDLKIQIWCHGSTDFVDFHDKLKLMLDAHHPGRPETSRVGVLQLEKLKIELPHAYYKKRKYFHDFQRPEDSLRANDSRICDHVYVGYKCLFFVAYYELVPSV